MKNLVTGPVFIAMLLSMLTCGLLAEAPEKLGGTSWRLVKFQGSDGTTLTPDDKSKYTIAFGSDGRVSARIDCNRGKGTWKSWGSNQLELSSLALTRAMCAPGSLHDQIVEHWQYVRSFIFKDGHLFLSLMADGGIYEFEPLSQTATSGQNVTTHLENTYWRLTDLADKPIHTAAHQCEPYVVLSSASHRVKGSGGCNRLTGSYKVHGDELIFHQTTSTMMACLEGMQTEKAFLDALKQVNRWKITGQELEFLDTTGKVLASFEAHQLKSK